MAEETYEKRYLVLSEFLLKEMSTNTIFLLYQRQISFTVEIWSTLISDIIDIIST